MPPPSRKFCQSITSWYHTFPRAWGLYAQSTLYALLTLQIFQWTLLCHKAVPFRHMMSTYGQSGQAEGSYEDVQEIG